MVQAQFDFQSWTSDVRSTTEAALQAFFRRKAADAQSLSPLAPKLFQSVERLTLRGGKRLRAIVAAAAHEAVNADASPGDSATLGASLELLQAYLLIHDDWMDQDAQRRGGPSVHMVFREDHKPHIADSLAVLAGDLACAWSWEMFFDAGFGEQAGDAQRVFAGIQQDVIAGQQLDVVAHEDVDRMHELKTGSYTVLGPATLGCLLGGGSKPALDVLTKWAAPLGIAFQLRDDLLGTFGNPKKSGKPGDDLQHGKRNAVIKAFDRTTPSTEQQAVVAKVFGNPNASATEINQALNVLGDSGARGHVETRLNELTSAAKSALVGTPLTAAGVEKLASVADALTLRGV